MRSHQRSTKLWKQSQTTVNFITPELSFVKQQRFKLQSIYWPEKEGNHGRLHKRRSETDQIARKVSKLIDQQEKNEHRMSKSQQRSSAKKINFRKTGNFGGGSISLRETSASNISKSNQEIIRRLSFHENKPQSTLRDRFGFRNPMPSEDPQFETEERLGSAKERRLQSASKGFRMGKRVDLKLPHNFYPGPGAYEIKRYLEKMGKQAPAAMTH